MKKLPFPLIIFVLLLCVTSGAAAQDDVCPSLSIVSPDHALPEGERGAYMANIDAKGKSLTLEYLWSASSSGRGGDRKLEFDGQGTSQITVIFPKFGSSVFVTLKVKGLPEGCPSEASDAMIVDLPPEATKLFDVQLDDAISKRDIESAASLLNDHPNDQLFILSGYVTGKSSKSPTTREAEIIRLLTDAGLSRERITLQNVDADRELIQVWVVPPGARPAICEDCKTAEPGAESQKCPTISLTEPNGITTPGRPITVRAKVSDPTLRDLSYRWAVKGSDSFSGQNTPNIRIGTEEMTNPEGLLVTVTVEIAGLPKGCPTSASESYPVHPIVDYFPMDQYGNVPFAEEKARLVNFAVHALQTPEMKGYVVKTFKTGTPQSQINRKLAMIKAFMLSQRKYPSDRFVFLVRIGDRDETILHILPAATVASSVCDNCKAY